MVEIQSITTAQQYDDKRFTKMDIIKTKRSVAFMLNFLPGQEMKAHNHPDRELYLHVFEGTGTLSIDGEEMNVKQNDVIYCQAEEKIGFTNTSADKVSIYATMTKLSE